MTLTIEEECANIRKQSESYELEDSPSESEAEEVPSRYEAIRIVGVGQNLEYDIPIYKDNMRASVHKFLKAHLSCDAKFRVIAVIKAIDGWNAIVTFTGRGGAACNICLSTNHRERSCPNRPNCDEDLKKRRELLDKATAALKLVPTCNKCKGKHRTEFCSEIARQGKTPIVTTLSPVKCYNCQAIGHKSDKCPNPKREKKETTRNSKHHTARDAVKHDVSKQEAKEKGVNDANIQIARDERERIKEEEKEILGKKDKGPGKQENANDLVEQFSFSHDCLESDDLETFASRITNRRAFWKALAVYHVPVFLYWFLDVIVWNTVCLVTGISLFQMGAGMAYTTTIVGTMYHGQNLLMWSAHILVYLLIRFLSPRMVKRLRYEMLNDVMLDPTTTGRRFSQHTVQHKINDQYASFQVSEELVYDFNDFGFEINVVDWKYQTFRVSMEAFYNHAQCTNDYTTNKVLAVELYQNIKKDPFIMRSRKIEAMDDIIQGTADLCVAWRLKCKEKQHLNPKYTVDLTSGLRIFYAFLRKTWHFFLLCMILLIVLNEMLKRIPVAKAHAVEMAVPVASRLYTYVSWDLAFPAIGLNSMRNNFANYYWRFNDPCNSVDNSFDEKRPSVGMTINPLAWPGVAPFSAHGKDPFTVVTGGQHRVAKDAPVISGQLLHEFREYVVRTLQANCDLYDDYDQPTLEEWLGAANYTEDMKETMRGYDITSPYTWKGERSNMTDCTGFIKLEPYIEEKWARTIRARSKRGGIPGKYARMNKVLEKSLFKLKCFIKKVKFSQRCQFVSDKFYEGELMMWDFSGYEGLFTKSIQELIQFAIMDTLMAGLSDWQMMGGEIKRVISKHGRTVFSEVSDWMSGKKKSGEQDTSSSNGGVNALAYGFVQYKKYGLEFDEIADELVVEGDDMTAQNIGRDITSQDCEDLGLVAKIEHAEDVESSLFCQIVQVEGVNVVDPIKYLAKFGLNHKKYQNAGLKIHLTNARAKALSTMAMANGAPVVTAFCEKILEITKSFTVTEKKFVEHTKFLFKESGMTMQNKYVAKVPSLLAYHVVGRVFKIDVAVLLLMENVIKAATSMEDLQQLNPFFPQEWVHNWVDNVKRTRGLAPSDYVMREELPEQFFKTYDPLDRRRAKFRQIDEFEHALNDSIIEQDWARARKCNEAIVRRRVRLDGGVPRAQVLV